jgi:uncharacterized protein YbjT (DUF2867 family)
VPAPRGHRSSSSTPLTKDSTVKLTVFGATGPTGREVVAQALKRGHQVTAVARRPEDLGPARPGLSVVRADVTAPAADLAESITGADAALAARTRSRLHALFADLPGPPPVPTVSLEADTAPAKAAPGPAWRGVAVPGLPLLLLVPVLLVLAVTAAVPGLPPFPLIPLLFILGRRHRRWNRKAQPWI